MAKNKNEIEEMEENEAESSSALAEWQERFEGQAREYLLEMEKTGGDLVRPGKGYIASVGVDSIYSYSVFKRRSNKKVFIDILQNVSDACQTAKILGYCVLDDSAYMLVKGNRKDSAYAFIEFVLNEFARKYNRGFKSVGYPFRKDYAIRQIASSELGTELNRIHSLSPNGLAERYPFCSYKYLQSGEHDANLILKLELDPSREDFEGIIQGMDGMSIAMPRGAEDYKTVKKLIDKSYAHQKYFREEEVGFMISEAAARSQTSYAEAAKNVGLADRYDLMVSAVCNFIDRRGCTYPEAISALGLADNDRLRIEVIAEINRVHHYSYDFIVRKIVIDESNPSNTYGDKDYTQLARLFSELNKKYGYTFEQLCVRFHVTLNLLYLRQLCGL